MEHDTAALCREAYDTYTRGDFEAPLRFFDRDDGVKAFEQHSGGRASEPVDADASR